MTTSNLYLKIYVSIISRQLQTVSIPELRPKEGESTENWSDNEFMCGIRRTLSMMCDESWPPSDECKFPGSPADSQLEHISTFGQTVQ